MNEFEILEKFIKPLSENHPSALNLSDDACIIDKLSTKQLVISVDSIVEGVHFLPNTTPYNIAEKLLAVNLSDIAAMGGTPKYYLLAAVFSKNLDERWISEFSTALYNLNQSYGVVSIGGDTVKHDGPICLSLTCIGEVDKYNAITRSGAKEGDSVYVTGTIGDAALGLIIEKGEQSFDIPPQDSAFLISRYKSPTARTSIGSQLANIANGMIDISDGFIQDACHIAKNSEVQLNINLNTIPFSDSMLKIQQQKDITEIALSGGDDYELLFTAPETFDGSIREIANLTGVSITKIGNVSEGNKLIITNANGEEVKFHKSGYQH